MPHGLFLWAFLREKYRYLLTAKATSMLFFLLQKPNVPGLVGSSTDIFEFLKY